MPEMMYREALNLALKEEMRKDSTVFMMGEGIAERRPLRLWLLTRRLELRIARRSEWGEERSLTFAPKSCPGARFRTTC